MSFRIRVLLLVLLVISSVSIVTYIVNRKSLGDEIKAEDYRKGELRVVDDAVEKAQLVYEEHKSLGTDFTNGPCLSNDLMTDWVVDVAHNPRTPKDDLPENQCLSYLRGNAHHFVEIDLEGNLIRIK